MKAEFEFEKVFESRSRHDSQLNNDDFSWDLLAPALHLILLVGMVGVLTWRENIMAGITQ